MNDDLDYIKISWKEGKKEIKSNAEFVDTIIAKAKSRMRKTLFFHYGNIAILTLTLMGVGYFFGYVLPFQEWLSRTGLALMFGGLFIRIIIEVFSTMKLVKIDISDDALKNTNDTLDFYKFRKKIHGPVTIVIVGLYTLGFYFLTPEIYKYVPFPMLLLIDGSYVIGAIFLIWQIRKGIRKEIKHLSEIVSLKKDISDQFSY